MSGQTMSSCGNCGAPLSGDQCIYCKSIVKDPTLNRLNDMYFRNGSEVYTSSAYYPITTLYPAGVTFAVHNHTRKMDED